MNTRVFDIHAKFNEITQDGDQLFHYLGPLDGLDVDGLIEKFGASDMPLRVRKRLVNIIIECVQNMRSYYCGYCADRGYDAVILSIGKSSKGYNFYIGNFVLNEDFKTVRSRLNLINGLSKEELRELYRGILDYGSVSQLGGAGLGFIDVAKRSEGPLVYTTESINDKMSFFTLKIVIGN